MSWRCAATDAADNWLCSQFDGIGVPGNAVPSSGANGPGFLYDDVQANGVDHEYRVVITSHPVGLVLYEDSAFGYAGPNTTFSYDLYLDGVLSGSATETLITDGSTPPQRMGRAKVWNGAQYVFATPRAWDGTQWRALKARRWDGTSWQIMP